jgi:hypothetical protein
VRGNRDRHAEAALSTIAESDVATETPHRIAGNGQAQAGACNRCDRQSTKGLEYLGLEALWNSQPRTSPPLHPATSPPKMAPRPIIRKLMTGAIPAIMKFMLMNSGMKLS